MSHILVVEDDPQFRSMLVQMLTQDGHHVEAAADGAEALRKLQQIQPELIITDILMPNMNGVDTIMALSQQGNTTPVIAISGGRRSLTSDFFLDSASLLGVKATLPKPFARNDLRKLIAEALSE